MPSARYCNTVAALEKQRRLRTAFREVGIIEFMVTSEDMIA